MKDSELNAILKKENLQLIAFLDTRPKNRRFLRIEDLKTYIAEQLKEWEKLIDTFPNCATIVQSFKSVEALIVNALGSEGDATEAAKRLAAEIPRDTYARPLLTFDRNPLPSVVNINSLPKDWIGIVVQKLAIPDQLNIFQYDPRITELYFTVATQISLDGTYKAVELERSLEWSKDFRDDTLTFIEEQEKRTQALEAERQKSFEENLAEHSRLVETFQANHDEILKNIEKTYEEKVRIAEPAKLWKQKQSDYQKQGSNWYWVSIGIATVICLVGFVFFLFFPEVVKNNSSGTTDYTGSLKWLLLVSVGIGALIFLLRQAVKLSISGFHMSRDAEEKSALTSFYLSLIANKSLDPEKEIEIRTIIMNSLFARVDTGLLKGDNSPTIPSGGLAEAVRLVGGRT